MTEIIVSTLRQSVMITAFVLFMMVVIEYINVQSKSNWADRLQRSPFWQIVVAALLGLTPGCMGAFTVVSLYTHRMMGLAGLVTVMIATSGDEAFVMFALFPGKALLLNGVLLIIALVTGWIVHLSTSNRSSLSPHGFVVHEHENCHCFVRRAVIPQLKKPSFERTVLLIFTVLFMILLWAGTIGPPGWNWKKITFLAGSIFLLFVFITVPDHFLKEHLYNHILKKHLLRLFLWTWGAFVVLHIIQSNLMLNNLLQNNSYLILLIAVLMGIIPESGPHLVFVTLFSQNMIPFSILLANSIVQDGHGMLPLLAESRSDFLKVKSLNMLVGFLAGLMLMLFGL
ncbi:MAG: arsenic efflux protein [Bacteroidales bacterium]|nr:arsenic efflux protein [Bacteroidales bacterium]